jgi:hypothetical protein
MRAIMFSAVLWPFAAYAQPTVAPAGEPTGNPRGENTSGYNIRQSFELGYRWRTIDGSDTGYRSMVNFGGGIRLLSTSLSVQSREGHGRLFDQIILNTQGLGNDPYQFANFRIEKNRLYRYDLTWRSNAYVNPGLRAPSGQHPMDTVRDLQDQNVTLFPQGAIRFFAGYSRNTQTGPGISTINLFDQHRGDVFPIFANIRRQQNEYRVGSEIRVLGFRLNLMHTWVNFKEDTPFSLTGQTPGLNPNDATALASFRRSEPYHGNSPYWRAFLYRESKFWAANGRFTYVGGRRAFVTDELATGANSLGTPVQRQVLSFGDSTRPAITGNMTFSLFPTSNVTITNQTSLYHFRMQGNNWFAQFDNNGTPFPVTSFEFLGIRTISNSTDAEARFGKRFAIHAGYVYDDRRIRSIQGFETPANPASAADRAPIEQTNQLHAGVLGLRIKPARALSINADAEIGRAGNPFYPVSERNYQALRGRIEYKLRRFRIAAYTKTYYNTNGVSLAEYSSRSRTYGIDASWNARSWFSIDLGYGKQHLDTLGTIAYFALITTRNQLISSDQSFYVSNIHTASLAGRFSIKDRVDISIGYSHIQDLGDGRASSVLAQSAGSPYTSQPAFYAAQTFPLRFNSPLAKVSVSITSKVRWNAGYQFYGYREDFATVQNYRAHTGYSSLSWSF